MLAIIGPLFVGAILGWLAALMWRDKIETSKSPDLVFCRHRNTGDNYRFEGFIDTHNSMERYVILTPLGRRDNLNYLDSNKEIWPADVYSREFDRVHVSNNGQID